MQMYNFSGKAVPNCRFAVSTQRLLELIRQRIGLGVEAFFKCIEKTILHHEKAQYSSNKVYIFLAGNSCKSKFVTELFEKAIKEYNAKYNKRHNKENDWFELILPLSGEHSDSQYAPNGKTSVAYGLVKSRPGGKILVIKNAETDSEMEAKFKYYLGTDRRGRFVCKLERDSYNIWKRFQGAGIGAARIYYTDNPGAASPAEQLSIQAIPFHEIGFEPDENKFLFIRAIKPTVIEYAIAASEEEISDVYELELE